MNPAYASAVAALAGSVIGALTAGLTTWLNQRADKKAGQREAQAKRLEALFADFIVAASRAYGEALINSEPKIEEIIGLYAMISQMRVVCSTETVDCAEHIMFVTIDTYFSPNKSVRELNQLMKDGVGIDPLRDFAAAARKEIGPLRAL